MIRSMTGFGRCEKETGDYKISVEIKAVNHRYLDVSIKMPKRFNCFESAIRSLLKQDLQRGKVDVFISCEQYGEQAGRLTYNAALAAEYAAYCRQMAEQLHIPDDLKTTSLARMPEVLVMEEAPEDEERLWELLSQTIKEAVGKTGGEPQPGGRSAEAGSAGKAFRHGSPGRLYRRTVPPDSFRVPGNVWRTRSRNCWKEPPLTSPGSRRRRLFTPTGSAWTRNWSG